MAKAETPLMKQYHQMKARYPGSILLFRVGDFYETFGEDAVKASAILNITLTKRSNGSASEVELAGFPHHALDTYLPKLVKAGNRVAVCDQVEDPKEVPHGQIVKRAVTELVTPGVSLNDQILDGAANNFLAAVYFGQQRMGLSLMDISTGAFFVNEGDMSLIKKLWNTYNPVEVLFCRQDRKRFEETFGTDVHSYALDDWAFAYDHAYELLTKQFKTLNLKGFGIEELKEGIPAAGAIMQYLMDTEHKDLGHILAIAPINDQAFVWMDGFTIRNLELLYPTQPRGTALVHVIDQTLTPMGGRLLRQWLVMPLKDKNVIDARLDLVTAILQDADLGAALSQLLKRVGDLERLSVRLAAKRAGPRDYVTLARSLDAVSQVQEQLRVSQNQSLKALAGSIVPCQELIQEIQRVLREEAPMLMNAGGYINMGVDAALDEYRALSTEGKDFLNDILNRESARTNIPSLKISYNKVFGYYLEVTNAHKNKVPADWIRKQTLTNAERYITPELKTYEEKILRAEASILDLEQRLFLALVEFSQPFVPQLLGTAKQIGVLDCLTGFAFLAKRHNYARPEINQDLVLDIKDGRHPVIERVLPAGETYVPNDTLLSSNHQQIMVITGPNMAGKSALLRQVALITIMAQMGCYVPATSAKIGLVDKIFTRVGASDNLSQGESTFMVEMTETATILNNMSAASLILMDEIGRGTSTYDGVSIAWSIVEYLHKHAKFRPRTLFATHYHELNELSEKLNRIKNYNVAVKDLGNRIIFMRKLVEGGSEHSFGIHVAQLAGMPNAVVLRAHDILQHLEKARSPEKRRKQMQEVPASYQLNFFDAENPHFKQLREAIEGIDVNTISGLDALLRLNEIKKLLATGMAQAKN